MRLRSAAFTLTLTLSTAAGLPAAAQSRPAQEVHRPDLVARGRVLFDDQQYEESIQVLSAALVRATNTREQKVDILRILSMDYITLGRKDEAEAAVRALYTLQPDFVLPATESPRFRDFYTWVKDRWDADGRPGLVQETEAAVPVTMSHSSPSQVEAGQSLELVAKVSAPERVQRVKLYFREGASGKFTAIVAAYHGGTARATIPGTHVRPPVIEYYLEGADSGGLAITSRGDAATPLRIAVPEPKNRWVLPLAIGGGIVGAAAALVGGLALAGVFKSNEPRGAAKVSITVE